MLTVQIWDDLAPRIAAAAARLGLSEAAFVREAVLRHLEQVERPVGEGALGRSAGPDEPIDRSAREHPGLGY